MTGQPVEDFAVLPPRDAAPAAQAMRLQRKSDGTVFYVYQHEHPAVASTVVLYSRRRNAVLLGKRSGEPYAGSYCFPGGFLDVGHESVAAAAVRELREETGAKVHLDALRLVDVRSAPERDPRDHVLDIGYYVEVEDVQARAADETESILWAAVENVAQMPLAFDHADLWRNVLEQYHPGQTDQNETG
jgi:8-oxo-dGTP diphosphatase